MKADQTKAFEQEQRNILAQYTTEDILSADTDLFLHAFEDYDGVFTKHAADMTPRELADAATYTHVETLLRYLA